MSCLSRRCINCAESARRPTKTQELLSNKSHRTPSSLPMFWITSPIRLVARFGGALLMLFISAGIASAVPWKSNDYNCQVYLPDSDPVTSGKGWSPVGSTEEGTLVGARRIDGSAFVFLGYVDIVKRPKFHLNEKTIEELEKRFFGPGLDSAVQSNAFHCGACPAT